MKANDFLAAAADHWGDEMKNEITTASHHEQSYNAADDDAVFGGDLCVDNKYGGRAAQIHTMQFLVSISVDNYNDGGTAAQIGGGCWNSQWRVRICIGMQQKS